jgi:hypothetical protein
MVLPSLAFLCGVCLIGLIWLGIWLGRKISSTKLKIALLVIWLLGMIVLYSTGIELIGPVPFFSLLGGVAFIGGLASGINCG